MIEVRVRDQHKVDRRQVGDAQAGAAQAFQYEEPAGEVGIDDDVLAANLQEETGVADEGDAEFSVGHQARLVRLAVTWRDGGSTHQASEIGSAFTKGRIADRFPDHPALDYLAAEPMEVWTAAPVLILVLIAAAPRNENDAARRFY